MAEDPGLINRAARAGAGNEEDNDFQLDLDLDLRGTVHAQTWELVECRIAVRVFAFLTPWRD